MVKLPLTGRKLPVYWIAALMLILKLALMRIWLFDGLSAVQVLADAASVIALLSLTGLVLPRSWRAAGYMTVNALLSLVLFAVTVYYAYYGSVPTYTALRAIGQVGQVSESVNALIQPVYYLYFADFAVLFAAYVLLRWRKVGRVSQDPAKFSRRLKDRARKWLFAGLTAGAAASCLFIAVNRDMTNELVHAERLGLIGYEITAAVGQTREAFAMAGITLEETRQQIEQLQDSYPYRNQATGQTEGDGQPASFGGAKGMNVIVVQMEAFQAFPIGLSVQGQEVTPVLNGLAQAQDSYYFPHIFQQIGQGNTSDAEFMSATSIYPTGKIAMSTGYGDRELPSLQRLLAERGYASATFHVNDVSFWDRNKLYPALGFDKYYDQPYYTDDHFNDFGASDEELYRVGTEKLAKLRDAGQPFYAQFVTASGHYPFQVPDDRKRLSLPKGLDGTFLGDYLQAVSYTDYALGTLIERLKAEGLWDNTMLIVYGDHFGVQPEKADDAFIQSQLGIPYDSRVSRFNIPLLMHVPGAAGGRIETTGGQLDIMPTAAGLLGISLQDENFTAFGQNLLAIDNNIVGMRYYLPTGSFFNNDIAYIPGESFDDGTALSLDTLQPVPDVSLYRSDYQYIMRLMELSDQYVEKLPKR